MMLLFKSLLSRTRWSYFTNNLILRLIENKILCFKELDYLQKPSCEDEMSFAILLIFIFCYILADKEFALRIFIR